MLFGAIASSRRMLPPSGVMPSPCPSVLTPPVYTAGQQEAPAYCDMTTTLRNHDAFTTSTQLLSSNSPHAE
jgi:hypothetical protein